VVISLVMSPWFPVPGLPRAPEGVSVAVRAEGSFHMLARRRRGVVSWLGARDGADEARRQLKSSKGSKASPRSLAEGAKGGTTDRIVGRAFGSDAEAAGQGVRCSSAQPSLGRSKQQAGGRGRSRRREARGGPSAAILLRQPPSPRHPRRKSQPWGTRTRGPGGIAVRDWDHLAEVKRGQVRLPCRNSVKAQEGNQAPSYRPPPSLGIKTVVRHECIAGGQPLDRGPGGRPLRSRQLPRR